MFDICPDAATVLLRFAADRLSVAVVDQGAGTKPPGLLVLDILETYARERDTDVRLERDHRRDLWTCTLRIGSAENFRGTGRTAREAIKHVLARADVKLPA
jgi:hypothetical protein